MARGRRLGSTERERGAIAVVVAVTCTLMFTLTALVIDLGLAQDNRRRAQNAADAGALAAAQYLARVPNPNAPTVAEQQAARALAISYVTRNEWAAGTAGVDLDLAAARVNVRLNPFQAASLFGGAFGLGTPAVAARAAATWGTASAVECVLCVLQDAPLQNGNVSVSGGSALINGNLSIGPQGRLNVDPPGRVGVFGAVTGTSSPPAVALTQPFPDPYAALVLPPITTAPMQTVPASGVCSPGNWDSTIETCTSLSPGVYVIGGTANGNSIKITGQSSFTANDVTLYFTCGERQRGRNGRTIPRACAPDEDGAELGGAGQGTVVVNAPRTGPYAGFAVIYDRNNSPKPSTNKTSGNGSLTLNGVFYAASAEPNFRGNGAGRVQGQVVVGSLGLKGNPSGIAITGSSNVPPPPARRVTHLVD